MNIRFLSSDTVTGEQSDETFAIDPILARDKLDQAFLEGWVKANQEDDPEMGPRVQVKFLAIVDPSETHGRVNGIIVMQTVAHEPFIRSYVIYGHFCEV